MGQKRNDGLFFSHLSPEFRGSIIVASFLKMKSVIKYLKTRWRMSDEETECYFPFETENLETY